MFARVKALLSLGFLSLLSTAALAASDWEIVKIGGREYLTIDNVAKFYGLPSGVAPIEKHLRLDNGKSSL